MTEDRPTYLLIPGFSQTARAWGAVVGSLPARSTAHPLDIPAGAGFPATARALASDWTGIWAGYSMGGRLALHIALDRPNQVETLVLVSATPGIADPTERAIRRKADEELAAWISARGREAFLDRWLAQPIFTGLDEPAARKHRLESAARIADQLLRLGQGVQEPLWDRLPELTMPVLAVAGARDEAYAAIAERTVAAIGPNARLHLVPGAGHALLQEQPQALGELLANI